MLAFGYSSSVFSFCVRGKRELEQEKRRQGWIQECYADRHADNHTHKIIMGKCKGDSGEAYQGRYPLI